MFPIHDLRSRTVGFGGRALEKVEPKYLNSPETPIYEKRKNLYALDLTRREILKEGYAVLVEGYTDVLGLYQGGVRNAAATLGTALTSDHFRQMARFTDRVILLFDADAAGIGASERGLDFYLEFDLDLRVASLPEGMDPADFMRSNTRDDFLQVVERSMPLPEFCVRKVLESHNLRDANARSRAVSRCVSIIANLERKESVSLYLKIVGDLAEVDHSVLSSMLDRLAGKQPGARKTSTWPAAAGPAQPAKQADAETPQAKLAKQALAILLDHPVLSIDFKTRLGDADFSDPLASTLLEEVARLAAQGAASADQVVEALQGRGEARNLATSLILTRSGNTREMSREEAQRQLDDIWRALEDLNLARQIRDLERALAELVRSADRDHRKEDELSTELFQLERQRRQLRGDS
jgi:DNA primase